MGIRTLHVLVLVMLLAASGFSCKDECTCKLINDSMVQDDPRGTIRAIGADKLILIGKCVSSSKIRPCSVKALRKALNHSRVDVRIAVFAAISKRKFTELTDDVLARARGKSAYDRIAGLEALVVLAPDKAKVRIGELLRSKHKWVRTAVAYQAAILGMRELLPKFMKRGIRKLRRKWKKIVKSGKRTDPERYQHVSEYEESLDRESEEGFDEYAEEDKSDTGGFAEQYKSTGPNYLSAMQGFKDPKIFRAALAKAKRPNVAAELYIQLEEMNDYEGVFTASLHPYRWIRERAARHLDSRSAFSKKAVAAWIAALADSKSRVAAAHSLAVVGAASANEPLLKLWQTLRPKDEKSADWRVLHTIVTLRDKATIAAAYKHVERLAKPGNSKATRARARFLLKARSTTK